MSNISLNQVQQTFDDWWAAAPKRDAPTVLAVAYWYAHDAWDAAMALAVGDGQISPESLDSPTTNSALLPPLDPALMGYAGKGVPRPKRRIAKSERILSTFTPERGPKATRRISEAAKDEQDRRNYGDDQALADMDFSS